MKRARWCLAISLAIHILAAILAEHYTITPVVRRRTAPSVEHHDELLADMLPLESIKRLAAVREDVTPSEVGQIQVQSFDLAAVSPYAKITPIMPEEVVFLPVISDPMLQESVLEPTNLLSKAEIVALGAGKHLRTVYIGAEYCIMVFSDDLQEMTRSFLLAMIERDYGKAHEIAGHKYPPERLKHGLYASITRIVYIGKPDLLRSFGMSASAAVPCQTELLPHEVIKSEVVIAMPWYNTKEGWFIADIYSTR